MMTARDLLEEITRIQPDFRAYWEGENYFRHSDGAFTVSGVFCSFTDYFKSRHERMGASEIQAIAALVEQCEKETGLRTAAYTCFLENIAGDPADESIAPFLSRSAQEFLGQWRPSDDERL